MEENESPRSPFWVQTATNDTRIQRYRHRLSSIFFNSLVLIIFLLFFAILSMVFIIPFLIDFSSHIFKPNLVKISWDSVNLLLVFVALVFGFLSRNVDIDEKLNLDNGFDRSEPEFIAGDTVMYGLHDQEMNSGIGLRRQKTSSSSPDLRELSPPWNHRDTVDPWRFSDDTHLNYYRVLESNRNYFRQRGINIYTPAPEMPQTPETQSLPPQPPAHTVKKKKKIHHNVVKEDGERSGSSGTGKILSPEKELPEKKSGSGERKRGNGEKTRARSSEPRRILSPVIAPVPEPSSPPPDSPLSERKKNGGNATKDFFTSFYHKKKKKLQRGRSVDNLGSLMHHSQPSRVTFQLPPHSPPRLPTPPILDLDNLFPPKKESPKKFVSVNLPPPSPPLPPPPPPPPRPTTTRVAPFIPEKPKVPFPMTSFNSIDDSSSGGESPMKHIPPPPPLPPFKMPEWKFAVEGDFVRLQSTLSFRSASPDGDEARSPSSDVDAMRTATTQQFYTSPDVDTKADNFIAKFRAGLKLERMSKLGPGPYPNDS